jgi:hypothetical protein
MSRRLSAYQRGWQDCGSSVGRSYQNATAGSQVVSGVRCHEIVHRCRRHPRNCHGRCVCRYPCSRIIYHPFPLFGCYPVTATLRLAPLLPTTVAVAQFPDIRHATDAVCDILNHGVALRELQRSLNVPSVELSIPVPHRMRRDHR